MAGTQKAPNLAMVPSKTGLVLQSDSPLTCPGCRQTIALTAGMTPAEIQAELAKPCPH